MKPTKLIKVWLLTSLPVIGLMACNNKEDEPEQPEIPSAVSEPIIGEWLENNSDDKMIGYTETHYESDGSMSVTAVIVNTEINEFINYDGTWSVEDNILTEKYNSPFTGQATTDRYHLMYSGKYSMIIEYDALSDVNQYDKIVAKHTLPIGESADFIIDDSEFVPLSYKSSNSHVASVDEKGYIQAKHPGFAYIIASSKIGNAVNKVTVTSSLIIDDYVQYMGKSIQEVTNDFGNIYITVPGDPITQRYFQIPNPDISLVSVGYAMQRVTMISAIFRVGVDMEKIMTAWDNAFGTSSNSQLVHSYIIERNGEKYYAMIDSTDGSLTILPYVETPPPATGDFSDSDFTQFAWLPGTPVIEAATKLNYDITFENIEDGFFDTITVSDNNAIESLSVLFETEEEPFPVTTIIMRCKKDITQEDLDPWLSSVFTATGEDLNPYTYDVGNGKVYVYFKTSGSRLNMYYSTSKRRK